MFVIITNPRINFLENGVDMDTQEFAQDVFDMMDRVEVEAGLMEGTLIKALFDAYSERVSSDLAFREPESVLKLS